MASFEPPTPKKAADARTAASMLDSLNLSRACYRQDATATQNLSGYEAMRRIRDDAAQFRRDYQNWRKGANKGAKGAQHHTSPRNRKNCPQPPDRVDRSQKSYPLQRPI